MRKEILQSLSGLMRKENMFDCVGSITCCSELGYKKTHPFRILHI